MTFQKFNTKSYCVGQKIIVGDTTFQKKTGEEIILLVGQCSKCNRKSMIVSNQTIAAETLGDFFKYLC